jgi:cobalt-zinc-cadmium efflux system outer membrane protein
VPRGRRRRTAGLLLTLLLAAAGSRRAAADEHRARADARGPVLRLESLVAEARERNPDIQVARDEARARAAIPDQASALDDPTLSWEAWNIPESLRVDRADNNIFRLSQKLPFPGKRRLAGEVALHAAERTAHEAGAVELDTVTAVKIAYDDLWEAHARLAVLRRERELLERFAGIAAQKYGVGEATQADVLRAQVELTHVVNEVQTAPLAIASAEAEIVALLSREPGTPLGVPEDPPAPRLDLVPARLFALALENRPDIAAQGADVAREESAEELARRSSYPDFEISVGRFVNYGQSDGFGAMASVTLPFVNSRKYQAGVAEADARLSAARSGRHRLEDRARREIEQAFLRAKTALLQYELDAGTHVPQAEQALRVAQSAYQSNQLGFLDLVDTLRRIESVHLDHVAAQADFERAYAGLERAVGVDLPRSAAAEDWPRG